MGVVIVILIALVIVAIGGYLAVQRTKATRTFAAAHGFTFTPKRWSPDEAGEFDLYRRGNSRSWSDVMTGSWQGRPITYADYIYTVNSGRSTESYTFSTVMTDLGCQMPQVVVRSRGALGRFAEETVGAPGIRFESVAFNDRYDVHCAQQDVAIEAIDARMIEELLGAERGINVAFGPDRILVWSKRRSMKQLPALLDDAVAIAGHVPDVVLRQYGAAPPVAAAAADAAG